MHVGKQSINFITENLSVLKKQERVFPLNIVGEKLYSEPDQVKMVFQLVQRKWVVARK